MAPRRLMLWALLAAVAAALGATDFSFEPPYSLVAPTLRDDVEKCSIATGFSFATGARPTVPQLSRMCDQPNCAAVLNKLVPPLINRTSSAETRKNAGDAFGAFGKGMLTYCWFFRTPNDPCPADPMQYVATQLPEQDIACLNATKFSFKLNATAVVHLYDSRINWLTICTSPSCADIYTRFRYFIELGLCNDYEMSKDFRTAMYNLFYMGCRAKTMVNRQYAPIPQYVFRPGPTLPLHLPDPTPDSPPTLSSPSLSSSSSGSGIDVVDEADDTTPPVPTTSSVSATTRPSPHSEQKTASSATEADDTNTLPLTPVTTTETDTSIFDSLAPESTATTRPPTTTASPVPVDIKVDQVRGPSSSPPDATISQHQPAAAPDRFTIPMLVSAAAIALIACVAFFLITRHKKNGNNSKPDDNYNALATPRGSDAHSSIDSFAQQLVPPPGESRSMLLVSQHKVQANWFQDIRVIGSGAYAVVYLVRDTRSNTLLASKRLVENHVTKEKIDDFVAEIELVSTLRHPCIVSFVGASWTNRTNIRALFEFMDGGDLRSHLVRTQRERGVWSADKLRIALDIAEALVYVHTLETPVVHRDLKSRNVLLSRLTSQDKNPSHHQRRAKLSDFGVAREQSTNHTMTTGVGTSRWLAPEVIVGGGTYDSACDIYSFGVVLSELDMHRVPFSDYGCSDEEDASSSVPEITIVTMVAMEGLQPSFSASCPVEILSLARRCLQFEAGKRPSAQEVVAVLSAMVVEGKVSDSL